MWQKRSLALRGNVLSPTKNLEKIFQIFQIFAASFRKSLKINERKAEPEGFEPSVRF